MKGLSIGMRDMLPLIKETLSVGCSFEFIPGGESMLPLIRGGKDAVTLSQLPERLSAGDIILYERENGQAVLHRIIWERKGEFYFCGDHQVCAERGITREMMVGVVSGIKKDGRTISVREDADYKKYVKRTLAKKRILCVLSRLKKYIMGCIENEKGNKKRS